MATLNDIGNKIFFRLEEDPASPTFWTQSEILDIVAEALCETTLVTGEPELRQDTLTIPANTNVVTMPPNVVALTRMESGSGEVRKEFLFRLDQLDQTWETQQDAAVLKAWFPLGLNQFGVYPRLVEPIQVAVNYIAFPVADLAPFTGLEAVPFQTEYQDAIADYGAHIARLKEGGLEFSQSIKEYDRFIFAMKAMSSFASRKGIARFSLSSGAVSKVNDVETR